MDTNIPMGIDSRLPLSVKPFPMVDPMANTLQAIKAADDVSIFQERQAKNLEQQRSRELKQHDKEILDDYLKNGGDLYSVSGYERAVNDLKGKVSSETYLNLGSTLDEKKDQTLKMKKVLSAMDLDQIAITAKNQDEILENLSTPVAAYDEGMKAGGENAAMQKFTEAKKATLAKMSAERNPVSGTPRYAPEQLKEFADMSPEDLKHKRQNTAVGRQLIKEDIENRYKTAKTAELEKFGGIKGTSKISEIRRMVAAGELTEEEGKRQIDKLSSGEGATGKGWKMGSADGKVFRSNPNEGRVQMQSEEGDWEDVKPKDLPPSVVDAMGGRKAQSAITQRYNQRTMTAAAEVLRNIDMIGSMPLGQTGGLFNYDKAGALTGLKNTLTDTDAENLETAQSGLALELTTLLRGGMALNEEELRQINKGAELRAGISVESARYKLANVIAKSVTALESFEPSTDQQSREKETLLKKMQKYPTPEQVLEENRTGQPRIKTYGEDLGKVKDRQDKKTAPKDFPKVSKEDQASRDTDRKSILQNELKDEESKRAKLTDPAQIQQSENNIAALKRELGVTETSKAPTKGKVMTLDEFLKSKGH